MREAQRSAPSIIYVPQIPSWWETVGPTLRSVFTTLLQGIPRFTPVLLLATSNVQLRDLPEEVFQSIIFFLFYSIPSCQPLEVLPVAPPPKPRNLTEEEIRQVEELEEDMLRELRIYLRDVAQRLITDKRFKAFTKPIDPEEVTNYKDTTKQPMDLSTVLSKIDMHHSGCKISDHLLRHKACTLSDTAYSIVRHEMDEGFERRCQKIKESRKERGT
ncbi:ATAD2 protein, partial [Oxylabes madagascariensis]|nr:ATAD2 protein [Oxylabes madagascariensis]